MSYLLDVDSCAAVVRKVARAHTRFLQNLGAVHVSVVALTELELWLTRARTPLRYQQSYVALLQQVALLNVDQAIAYQAARVGSILYEQGRRVSTADLLIAATAMVHNLTLVTHGTQVFAGVPGLSVEDWRVP